MVSSHPIIGIDIKKKKIKDAYNFGMTKGFDANDKSIENKILNLLKGSKPDFVIDTTGIKK